MKTKYYYAIFARTAEAVEVEFPDLPGCVTFGGTWEDAYEHAVDVLAGWLTHAEPQFIKAPSAHEDLQAHGGEIIPIPVDAQIMAAYQQAKRFQVTFPAAVLERMDLVREKYGVNRSTLLLKAVEDYLEKHHTDVAL